MAGKLVGKPLLGELRKDAAAGATAGALKTDLAAGLKLLDGMVNNPQADFRTIAGRADVGVFHGQAVSGLHALAEILKRMRSVG